MEDNENQVLEEELESLEGERLSEEEYNRRFHEPLKVEQPEVKLTYYDEERPNTNEKYKGITRQRCEELIRSLDDFMRHCDPNDFECPEEDMADYARIARIRVDTLSGHCYAMLNLIDNLKSNELRSLSRSLVQSLIEIFKMDKKFTEWMTNTKQCNEK